jgi:16S rRNA (guanine527-N7)-methyltransferase
VATRGRGGPRGPEVDLAKAGARLAAGAARLGLTLDEGALADLGVYLGLLQSWNERLNLVGEHDVASLVDRHVVDSLAATAVLGGLPAGSRMVDLGSGAGLPGVPLAIALRPGEMVLVEPRRKRASFLRAVQRALPHAGLRVVERRAEDFARDEAGRFAGLVTRAALPDAALLPLAAHLLQEGGILVSYRGVDAPPDGVEFPGLSSASAHAYRLDDRRRPFQLHVRHRLRST